MYDVLIRTLSLSLPSLGVYKIPTWTSPLIACVFVSLLVSDTSFLGHLCAILFGYGREFIPALPFDILTN